MALSYSNILDTASSLFNNPSKVKSPSSLFSTPAQNALSSFSSSTTAPMSTYKPPAAPMSVYNPAAPTTQTTQAEKPAVAAPAPVATAPQSYSSYSAPAPLVPSYTGAQTTSQTTPMVSTPSLSYPGLVGSIADSAKGLGAQASTINSTANQIGQQGQMTPEEIQARQRLADLTGVAGTVNSNIEQHPSDFAFQMGREAVAGRNIEAQRQSLADQVAAYAAQRQASTAAYQGQASAQGVAGGLLTSAGGLEQGAAQLAQPQLSQYGQTYYNPLGAGQTQGQGGDISAVISQYAQGLQNNTIPYSSIPSSITSNPVLNAQLLQAAGGQGFNLNTSLGTSAAQQSNTQLGGTAVQGANAAVYQQALPAYYEMNSQLQNVEGLGNLLLTTAQGGEINPFSPQFANMTVAQLRSQLSSPEQTRFNSTLASFQGAASQLLANSSGQIPTDVSKNISLLASGNLSLGALKAMVDQAQKEGSVKLTNQGAIVNNALQTLQQGSGAQAPASTQSGSGIFNF